MTFAIASQRSLFADMLDGDAELREAYQQFDSDIRTLAAREGVAEHEGFTDLYDLLGQISLVAPAVTAGDQEARSQLLDRLQQAIEQAGHLLAETDPDRV